MQQMRNPRHILVLLCYWKIVGCDVFNGIPQGLGCFSMSLKPMSSMSCLSTSQHTSLWKGFTTVQQICCALWHGCSCQCQGPLTYKLEILKVNTLIFDHPFPFNLGDIWRDNSRRTRGKEHVRSKDHIRTIFGGWQSIAMFLSVVWHMWSANCNRWLAVSEVTWWG
jgi:hypothetical protein